MPIPSIPASPSLPAAGTVLQKRFAQIGDLLLGGVDDHGSRVYLEALEGWDGASGTTLEISQRASDDGAWLGEAYLPARLLNAVVTVNAASFPAGSRSLQRLLSLVPRAAVAEMAVTDHDEQLVADVVQSGEILATRKGALIRLSVPLVAPDPRRYDPEPVTLATGLPSTTGGLRAPFRTPVRVQAVVASGVLTAVNDGTHPTHPVLTVVGPCPPFTITNRTSGASMRFHDSVPAGRSLVLDCRNRTALMDGTTPRYVTGVWPTYDPGANDVAFTADTFDAQALLVSEHRHAYL